MTFSSNTFTRRYSLCWPTKWSDTDKIDEARFSRTAGPKIWEKTGLTPADMDLACMYDCFTYTVMATMEGYGFCEPGQVGAFFAEGRATTRFIEDAFPGGWRPKRTHARLARATAALRALRAVGTLSVHAETARPGEWILGPGERPVLPRRDRRRPGGYPARLPGQRP